VDGVAELCWPSFGGAFALVVLPGLEAPVPVSDLTTL
jgi:hypothetical protein